MNILVCGGRDFSGLDEGIEYIYAYLSRLLPEVGLEKKDIQWITGCAKGADQIPYIIYYGDPGWKGLLEFPAKWRTYGKSAGYIRNKQMLEEGKPSLVFAFPGGKGTENMVRLAKKAGDVLVVEVGKDEEWRYVDGS